MAWTLEFSAAAERDFEQIFDHLYSTYVEFGDSPKSAYALASERVDKIREDAHRMATAPHRGDNRDDILSGVRSLTLNGATYWFDLDDARQEITVLAVFYGGQDQVTHMLRRLLSPK